MRNFKLTVAYDGAAFHGWQRQPGLRTVQETLEQALRRVLRHQVYVIGAGRTDSGVHAAGQEANVFTTTTLPPKTVFHAVGARLPKDMTLIHLEPVPLSFHATRSAISKLYRYRAFADRGRPVEALLHHCTYHFWHVLDVDRMREAARAFIGTHDFSALASKGSERTHNVRTVFRCDVYRVGREVRFDVEGSGFLYNQVRNMVGTLLEVGRGQWPPQRVAEIIASRDRAQAGPTAPARGLCLQWVRYDLRSLPPDPPGSATEPSIDRPATPGASSSTMPTLPPGIDLEEEPSG